MNLMSFTLLSSFFNLLTFFILAKILSSEDFGILTFAIASVSLCHGLSCSQSWQTFLKYNNNTKENTIKKFTFLFTTKVDFINILLSVLIFFLMSFTISDNQLFEYLLIYSFTLPFKMTGTFEGIVRKYDKIRVLSTQLIINSLLKLSFTLSLIFFECLLLQYIIISFVIAEIVSALYLIVSSIIISRCEIIQNNILSADNHEFNDLFYFTLVNHLNVSSVMSLRYIDEYMIGLFMGVENAGIFKLFKLICSAFSKLTEPFYILIYKEFVCLVDTKKYKEILILSFDMMKKSFYVFLLYILVIVFLGKSIIIYFSSEFNFNLYFSLIIYSVGVGSNLVLFYSHPLAISLKLELNVLKINIYLGCIYILFLFIFCKIDHLILISTSLALYLFFSNYLRYKISMKRIHEVL